MGEIVNKLKVAGKALLDYLGADSQGKALLAELMEVANEYRTRCPTLEASAAESKSAAQHLRGELDAAQLKIASLQNEVSTERARRSASDIQRRSLEATIASMQESEVDEPPATGQSRRRGIEKLIDKAISRFKKMPKADTNRRVLYVDDFIKSFTNDELMDIGLLVSVCGFMGLSVYVDTEKPAGKEPGWKESYGIRFMKFYKGWLRPDPLGDRVFVESGGLRPESAMPEKAGGKGFVAATYR